MNSVTNWYFVTFSIILSRIIQKWILLIVILSLGTSRDYAQISKGKGGTLILRMFWYVCNMRLDYCNLIFNPRGLFVGSLYELSVIWYLQTKKIVMNF